jgi:hypothetical protein
MSHGRAFISYSHGNGKEFDAVVEAVRRAGLELWSDRDLAPGNWFTDQIKTRIEHAHVFVPIITPESHQKGWVHQEIGYALAMRLPVVPVCIGRLPDGMIQMKQAVVARNITDGLHAKMQRVNFKLLIEEASREPFAQISCPLRAEERALMLEHYADEAKRYISLQCVRHLGGFSSFSFPDAPPHHDAWRARYPRKKPGAHTLELFRRERKALQQHAESAGCRLILNPHLNADKYYGRGATHTRYLMLIDFLESLRLTGKKVQVALVKDMPWHSLLLVGDWFLAESHSWRAGEGSRHTAFTTHAPAIRRRVEEFDSALAKELDDAGISPEESLPRAIRRLRRLMGKSPPHPAWPRGPKVVFAKKASHRVRNRSSEGNM